MTKDDIIKILSDSKYWCPSKKEQYRRQADVLHTQYLKEIKELIRQRHIVLEELEKEEKESDYLHNQLDKAKQQMKPLLEVLETIEYLDKTNCDWDKGTQLMIVQAIKNLAEGVE